MGPFAGCSDGKLSRGRFDAIVVRLATLAAERVGLSALLLEAHVIADRVLATDAFYVALARARDVDLLTTDAHLRRAAGRWPTFALSGRGSRTWSVAGKRGTT